MDEAGTAPFMSPGGLMLGYRSDADASKLIRRLLQFYPVTISVLWCGAFPAAFTEIFISGRTSACRIPHSLSCRSSTTTETWVVGEF